MGRIVDLISEIASEADFGPEGVELPAEAYERLRRDWDDDDIEDARALVHDRMLQDELVECADSLSARLLDVLGEFGSKAAFGRAQEGGAVLTLEIIGQLVRRVNRLEEVLDAYRDDPSPDRSGFDELRQRLMDVGIEEEMALGREDDVLPAGQAGADEDEEEED